MSKFLPHTIGLGAFGMASFFWGRSSQPAPTQSDKDVPSKTSPNLPVPVGSPGQIASAVVSPEGFYKYGFPGPVHDLAKHDEFISCYDRQTRNPYWILEHLTKESISRADGVDRKKSVFKEDESIPLKFRARLRDYFRSGYDRGHQAPAADAKFSQQAMDDTFLLTNISPQVGDGFNRDYWAHVEDFVRRLTARYDSVRVMTGPLYLPKKCSDDKYRVTYEVIGSPPNIAVPTHFFKLVVGENNGSDKVSVGAFVLPNEPIANEQPLTAFQVPVEALERSTGLELLHR
ncbi:nuclease, partial [Candidozyma auris]